MRAQPGYAAMTGIPVQPAKRRAAPGRGLRVAPTIYRPADDDSNGYRGRTGIYELIAIDDNMRTMIHDGVSEQDLEKYARTLSPGIRADGRRRVLEGSTTLEEVLRVTRAD